MVPRRFHPGPRAPVRTGLRPASPRPRRLRSRSHVERCGNVGRSAMSEQERDFQCLLRVKGGDQSALAELYDRYTPLVYPVALRIVRSPADAEDVVQKAWLQVWRSAGSYDPRRGTVAAWLLTVARSRALDQYRSLASRRRAEGAVDPEPVVAPPDASVRAVQGQLSERVRRALDALQPQQRRVLEIA